jgi:cob(I)alamin adenosyltransferase
MTAPRAIRQFISLCGGAQVAKGSYVAEPSADGVPVSRVMGQCDYLALAVSQRLECLTNPFPLHSTDAALWAAGRLYERRAEREAVEMYTCETARKAQL